MLVSYQWLQDYVDLSGVSPEEVAELLTRGGLEVDHIHRYHDGMDGVVVGKITDSGPHPDADKLTICQVDLGDQSSQIICGATNAPKASKVVVAKPGTVLPGNRVIEATEIRGQKSEGMICALDELGVSENLVSKEQQDLIIELPDDAEVGSDALEYLGLNDVVLEIDLTPNRSDALSMLGVAYDISALLDRPIKVPEIEHSAVRKNAIDQVSVTVEAGVDVPYYGAKIINKVTIAPSPLWMQMRLVAAGMRPVNNVVDITNYVMLETGQPLHAFDYDRFGSKEIVTRRAYAGETMTTLDEQVRTLNEENIVITNGHTPTALAGVMGGASCEVIETTENILLEAAQFDSVRVRNTAKRTNLRSESSTRFEKGLDAQGTVQAAERAAYLLEKYAGGSVLNGIVESGEMPVFEQEVELSLGAVNTRLGTELDQKETEEILYRLGFGVEDLGDRWRISIPSRRLDINIQEDLIEEIARIYGYDRIPTTYPVSERSAGRLSNTQKLKRKARRFLEGAGLEEAITYSLTSEDKSKRFRLDEFSDDVRVLMPMSEERKVLRQSLLPQLLDSISYNKNRQNNDLALFEMGAVFLPNPGEKLPSELWHIAGAFSGNWTAAAWNKTAEPVDFYTAKGIVEGLLEQLGLTEGVTYQVAKREQLHPGQSADVLVNGQVVGFIGQLHPTFATREGLPVTYVFELRGEALLTEQDKTMRYDPLPRFPAIKRDFAVVVDAQIAASEVQHVIYEAAGTWVKDVTLFDVYEGEHLEPGKKSLAYSVTFLNKERTLVDEEIAKVHETIVERLQSKLGASLRG